MSLLVEAIEETYCEQCHLATPVWKLKCIHCGQSLSDDPAKPRVAEKRSKG